MYSLEFSSSWLWNDTKQGITSYHSTYSNIVILTKTFTLLCTIPLDICICKYNDDKRDVGFSATLCFQEAAERWMKYTSSCGRRCGIFGFLMHFVGYLGSLKRWCPPATRVPLVVVSSWFLILIILTRFLVDNYQLPRHPATPQKGTENPL